MPEVRTDAMTLNKADPSKLSAARCGNCRWWAPWMQERMLGTCGHRDSVGCTDKWETCANHEPAETPVLKEMLS